MPHPWSGSQGENLPRPRGGESGPARYRLRQRHRLRSFRWV